MKALEFIGALMVITLFNHRKISLLMEGVAARMANCLQFRYSLDSPFAASGSTSAFCHKRNPHRDRDFR
jgi:hypothetical protein